MSDWITTSWASLLMVLISAIAVYAAIITLTRISGIRSFSKMSGFDFAITIATGSVIASVLLTEDPPVLQGLFALAVLYALQMGVAALRYRSQFIELMVDNRPRLIMCKGQIQEDQMRKAKITNDDLFAKLREANVTRLEQVHAVIAETTGDISVLHGPPDSTLDAELLRNVIGAERYKPR